MSYTVDEFAGQIKQKYPEYKDWDNGYLAKQIVEKHPEYKDWVSFEQPKPSLFDQAKTLAGQAGEAIKEGASAVSSFAKAQITPPERPPQEVYDDYQQPDTLAGAMESVSTGKRVPIRPSIAEPVGDVRAAAKGVAQGLSLGYYEPKPEEGPRRVIQGIGEFIGASAPIILTGAGVATAMGGTKLAAAMRPLVQRVTNSLLTGGIYGAARNPQEEESRLQNAADDAAIFVGLHFAGEAIAKAGNSYLARKIMNPERGMVVSEGPLTNRGQQLNWDKIFTELNDEELYTVYANMDTASKKAALLKSPRMKEVISKQERIAPGTEQPQAEPAPTVARAVEPTPEPAKPVLEPAKPQEVAMPQEQPGIPVMANEPTKTISLSAEAAKELERPVEANKTMRDFKQISDKPVVNKEMPQQAPKQVLDNRKSDPEFKKAMSEASDTGKEVMENPKTGNPVVWFHGTVAKENFDKFEKGDIGFHFGSNAQADSRISESNRGEYATNARIIPAFITVKNPYDVVTDLGQWNDMEMLREYFGETNEGPLSKEFSEGKIKTPKDFVDAMKSKGYDGITYENMFEGDNPLNVSERSVIVFDDSQIHRVLGGKYAKKTGAETQTRSEEKGPVQREGAGLRLRDNAEPGLEVQAGKEEVAPAIVTDAATVTKIQNSIKEAEMTLRFGKFNGRKLSPEELANVQRSVNKDRAKLGLEQINYPQPVGKTENVLSTREDIHRDISSNLEGIDRPDNIAEGEWGQYKANLANLWSSQVMATSKRYDLDPAEYYKSIKPKIYGPTGDMPSGPGKEMFQDPAPEFYSKLQRTLEAKMPEKASAQQVLGIIKETGKEERKWSGIDDFLAGKDKVSKQELLDFVNGNHLEIEEKILSNKKNNQLVWEKNKQGNLVADFEGEKITISSGAEHYVYGTGKFSGLGSEHPSLEMAKNAAERFIGTNSENATRFSQWKLPGGENYREILYKFPEKTITEIPKDYSIQTITGLREDKFTLVGPDGVGQSLMGPSMEDAKQQAIGYLQSRNVIPRQENFQSSHWPKDKGVFAHTRVSDRVDSDGKRVLFLEEIQSDWHQAGREKGYKENISAKEKELDLLLHKDKYAEGDQDRIAQLRKELSDERTMKPSAVPDAPFRKTIDKGLSGWAGYVLKKLIRYASENGYEKIAWTTGEQQAARYDLSKQIERIRYTPKDKELQAWTKGKDVSYRPEIKENVEPERLAEYIGKDAADKIRKGINSGQRLVELSGLDLKVGGEGMKSFYDEMLPLHLNDFAKKYGSKVDEIELAGVEKPKPPTEYTGDEANWIRQAKGNALVHSLDITPAMRNAALNEGFPLFQNPKDPLGSVQFTPSGPVIKLFGKSDASTLIHEMAHVWAEQLNGIAKGTSGNVKFMADWKVLSDWLKIKPTQEKLTTAQHEKFAQGFEEYMREGKAPSLQLKEIFESFKKWLSQIYAKIRALPTRINDDVRRVFDNMLATEEELVGMSNITKDILRRRPNEAGFISSPDMTHLIELGKRYFLRSRGMSKDIDIANDNRIGKILVTAFDAPLTGKEVRGYLDKNPQASSDVLDFLTGKTDINSVPSEIREPVKTMRSDIDQLSNILLENGVSSSALESVIFRGLGSYLTRAYRLFETKKWEPTPEVITAAKNKLKQMHPNTLGKISEEEMDGVIKNILDRSNNFLITPNQKPIVVPQNHFIKRKNIPEEIRALYGEIKNPVWLYLKTINDMSVVAHNGQFLKSISELPDLALDSATTSHFKRIPEGKRWGQLSGKFVDENTHEFLMQYLDPTRNRVIQFIDNFVTNPFKWTKTVGSLPSQARNYLGNLAFDLLLDKEVSFVNPANWKYHKKAFDIITKRETTGREMWKEMILNGVVESQYWGSEMPKLLNDMLRLDTPTWNEKLTNLMVKLPIEKASQLYNMGDQIHRVAGYLKLRANGYSNHAASKEIDAVFTNYRKVPEATKIGREFAVFGPFMSFRSEVARIIYTAAEDGIKRAKQGDYSKLVKLAFVLGLPYMMRQASMTAFNVDENEVKKLENIMPVYRRHGSIVYFRNSEGKLQAFDFTYLWPTGDYQRAIQSLMSGDITTFSQTLNLMAHPIFDAMSIVRDNRSPYWNKEISKEYDPFSKQVKDRALEFLRTIYLPASMPIPDIGEAMQGKLQSGPLTGYQVVKIIDAAAGKADRFGRTRSVPRELTQFLSGINTWPVDPSRVKKMELMGLKKDINDEVSYHKRWLISNKSVEPQAKKEAFLEHRKRLNEIHKKIQFVHSINIDKLESK